VSGRGKSASWRAGIAAVDPIRVALIRSVLKNAECAASFNGRARKTASFPRRLGEPAAVAAGGVQRREP